MAWQGGAKHGQTVMEVLNAALYAADPYHAVLTALEDEEAGTTLTATERIYVLGAGKAGAAMARAAEDFLGSRVTSGLVVVKDAHAEGPQLRHVELVEAAHPVPDERGAEATARLLEMAQSARDDDAVLCLISGGGSALLVSPAEGITVACVQETTSLLLRAGATINELNAVRKHLSRVAGGQLARASHPARVLSLILSDVIGSPLDVIASGPTAPDPTTYVDALAIIERYGLAEQVPGTVSERLRRGASGELPETPKSGDPIFRAVRNKIVASNVIAVEAAERCARDLGLHCAIMSTHLEGEAREVGKVLAGIAREIAQHNRPLPRPACALFGGETTVTVRGSGAGGRNSELALSAALSLQGLEPDVVVASFATDGGDGASPGAGAIVDGTTIDRAKASGLDPRAALADNDSYTFLAALGDAIITGPTGTNVNDVMGVFVF